MNNSELSYDMSLSPLRMKLPSVTFILTLKSQNFKWSNGLVSKSASWSLVETWWTRRSCPAWTCSRPKRYSNEMCFILEWRTGLVQRCVAPALSQRMSEEAVTKEIEVQLTDWTATWLLKLQLLQDTRLPPRKTRYAEVEVWSSEFPPQLASEYATKWSIEDLLSWRP